MNSSPPAGPIANRGSQPLRILMTADTVGGVWTYALHLAQALRPAGVQIHLASMGRWPSKEQTAAAAAIDNLTLIASDFALEWMDEPWADVARAGTWLLGLAEELQPDVVHLNGYAHAALPFAAPKLIVGHSCVVSWWQAVRRSPLPNDWQRYRAEVAAGLAAANYVVAPSRAMLWALEAHYELPHERRVIYNASPQPPTSTTPTERENEPAVMAGGRLWDEAKNIQALVDVAPRLECEVWIAGEARPGDDFAGEHVRFLGPLVHAAFLARLRRAAIYALPARYEPFGLSILEAAWAGCALVLGDIASLRELWGDAALYVPPDDRDALEETINRLLRAPRERQCLAARAQHRARRYSLTSMAAEYLDVYRQLRASRSLLSTAAQAEH